MRAKNASAVTRDQAEVAATKWLKATGKRLKAWREHVDMSQMEVAYNVDVGVDSLRSYEAGRRPPSAPTLYKISVVLGIQLQDLLFKDPPAKRDA